MIGAAVKSRFEAQVKPRLGRLRLRLRLYLLLDGLAVLSVALTVAVAITLAVDRTFKLNADMRVAQLVSLAAALAAIAWRFVIDPLRIRLGTDQLALLIERRHAGLRSRLISAVEFASAAESPPRGPRSPALAEAVVGQATEAIRSIRFEQLLAHRRARARAAVTLGCALALTLASLLAHTTMAVWFRRNVLIQNVDWPQRNRLTVEGLTDGRMIVARGDDAQVTASVDAGYEPPRQVFIEYRGNGGPPARQQMPAVTRETSSASTRPTTAAPSSAVRFTYAFERLAETLHCRVVGGDARTEWFTLEAVDRPDVRDIALHVTPPAYTKADPYDLRAGQTVAQALRGSRIGFRIRTNRPVADIRLIRQAGERQQEVGAVTRAGEREFTAEDLPPASSIYWFQMTDALGLSNVSERSRPVQITVRLTADPPPSVKMRVRGAGEMIVPEAVLPLEMEFADTYGLASAALTVRAQKENAVPTTQPIEGFEPGTKTFRRSLDWVPARHRFREGETIGGQRFHFLMVDARQAVDVAGDVLDLLQRRNVEDVPVLHLDHQDKRLSSAVVVVLAVELDVTMALGEEVRKFSRDLDLGNAIDHERADTHQEQAYGQAPAQDELADSAQAFRRPALDSFHHSGRQPKAHRVAPSGLALSFVDGLYSVVSFGCQRSPPCSALNHVRPVLICDEGLLSVIQQKLKALNLILSQAIAPEGFFLPPSASAMLSTNREGIIFCHFPRLKSNGSGLVHALPMQYKTGYSNSGDAPDVTLPSGLQHRT